MTPFLIINQMSKNRGNISIFIVWLFHLTAILGVTIGYEDWFISKTPINLFLIFLLLLWSFPEKSLRLGIAIGIFFIGGMLFEWLGVHYGLFFGNYVYGNNLGPKLSGVPWFIGLNWAVLTIASACIASSLFENKIARVFFGAGLMVFLDLFLEESAPIFDFWIFENGLVPLKNYIGWFGISLMFNFIYQSFNLKGDSKFSYHIFIAQLVFFVYFYGFYNI
jgi:putative membrane protein